MNRNKEKGSIHLNQVNRFPQSWFFRVTPQLDLIDKVTVKDEMWGDLSLFLHTTNRWCYHLKFKLLSF